MPFTIDFETGDTSQLTYDAGLSVDSGMSGDFCAISNAITKCGGVQFSSALEKVIQFQLLIPTDFNFPGDYESAYFVQITNGGELYDAGWSLFLRRFGDSEVNALGCLKSDFSIADTVITPITRDTILNCEIDYKSGDGDGHFIFKVDDEVIFNYTELSNADEPVTYFHFGLTGGNDLSAGALYFDDITDDIGGGPIEQDVNQTTETDSALALSKAKTKDAGLSSETNSALSLSALKIKDVGIISESDSALAVASLKTKDISLISETDSALNLSSSKTHDIGLCTSNEQALSVSFGKVIEIGIASETETVFPLTSLKVKETGIVTETDAAQTIDVQKTSEINYASEINTAQSLDKDKEKELGLVSETDTAFPVTLATDLYNITLSDGIFISENVFEFDVDINSENFDLGSYQVAIGFNQSIINGGILSMELVTDSSELISNPPTAFVGVIDVDGVFELAFGSFPGEENISVPTRIGRFRVTNTEQFVMADPELAFDFTGAGTTYIQDASFNNITDQELFDSTIEFVLFNSLGIVSEIDSALALTVEKIKEISLINEVDLALPITFSRTIEIGIAEEIEFAQQLSGILKEAQINFAEESEIAISLLESQFVDLGLTNETDIAQFVKYLGYDPNKLTADMIKGMFASMNSSGRFSNINAAGQFTNENIKGIFEVIK